MPRRDETLALMRTLRRRSALTALGLPALARLAAAAPPYPGARYRHYSRCLPDFLRGLAERAYSARESALSEIGSPDAVRRRQQWARSTFWRLVGGEPARTPLGVRVTGKFERPSYRVENLVYESRPGLIVTANLYVPKQGRPPYPGVLFQMGHSAEGKMASNYQRCCQALAALGFVVLAFDPMGQGERVYYPGPNGRTRRGSPDGEHNQAGRQLLLVGDSATRMQVWDAVRS